MNGREHRVYANGLLKGAGDWGEMRFIGRIK